MRDIILFMNTNRIESALKSLENVDAPTFKAMFTQILREDPSLLFVPATLVGKLSNYDLSPENYMYDDFSQDLTRLFEENPDKAFSIIDIAAHLLIDPNTLSLSYRLDLMTDDGVLEFIPETNQFRLAR